MRRSSDGAHQLSGGAIELHSQGSPVGESKQHVPAPGCPVGRDAQFASPLIHFYTVSANLVFEKATGTLINVFSGFWSANEADMMSPELLRALCNAKCDAVEATPLS